MLQYKSVYNMTGNLGRKRRISSFVVTGNGQGLAGFALGKAVEGKGALITSKNRAGQKLMFIERYNDHTGTERGCFCPFKHYLMCYKQIGFVFEMLEL